MGGIRGAGGEYWYVQCDCLGSAEGQSYWLDYSVAFAIAKGVTGVANLPVGEAITMVLWSSSNGEVAKVGTHGGGLA